MILLTTPFDKRPRKLHSNHILFQPLRWTKAITRRFDFPVSLLLC